MKRTGLRIFCLILSITALWTFTSCNVIIINEMDETTEVTESDTQNNYTTDTVTSDTDNSGHAQNTETKAETSTTYDTTEQERSNDVLAKEYLIAVYKNSRQKFNDITFMITTTDAETIAPDVSSGSEIAIARAERNQLVEKRFGVSLVTKVSDVDTIYWETRDSILADTYYTDILAVPQSVLGTFYAAGLLMNIRTLPYITLNSPYFNQSSIDAASGGFGVYGVSGDAVFNPNRMTGIYLNKDLIREAGIELPYKFVYDGTWTWDKLFSISAAVTDSLNSDERQIYSTTSMLKDDITANLIYESTGNKYMNSKVMTIPSVGFSPSSVSRIVDILKTYLKDLNKFKWDTETQALAAFTGGDSVYMIARLYVMSWMANLKTDWGIVPLPKFSESQASYQTLADSSTLMFAVPLNNNNVDAASVVLQGLNAASYGHITDKFINHHMNYIMRDNDSINMIEMIMKTQVFDFALMFGNSYESVKDGTVSAVLRAAKGESMENLFALYSGQIRDEMTSAFQMSN